MTLSCEEVGMDAALQGLAGRGYLPSVVYDIGAADGGWARAALAIWPAARFVCFEPLAERWPALEALKAKHTGRVQIEKCGIGSADEELSIGITPSLYDSSFAYPGPSSRQVPVRRIDTLVEQGAIALPSFVKVDVQGYEKRVLEGGRKAFAGADLVLLECQFMPFCAEMRTLDVTFADMASRGFVPYEFVDFLRRPLDGAMGQCDVMFVRRDHWLISDTRWGA